MGSELTLEINGETYKFTIGWRLGQIPESETLLKALRERIGLAGTKMSCGQGVCGCCAVLMDGRVVASCITLIAECGGKEIVTVEGSNDSVIGELDPVQEASLSHNAFQCGFHTPGTIIAVKSLLNKNSNLTEEEIEDILSGNYCHCISHYQVTEAAKSIL